MARDGTLSIRSYRPGDLDAVIAVFRAAVRGVPPSDYTPEEVGAWAELDRDRWAERRASRPTWVALLGKSVIGFADLEPDGHLDMMYVHPDHQRAGVATALLNRVEAAARARGLSRISTEASITARPFFERRGFAVVAAQAVEKSGLLLRNFRMLKVLD